MSVHICYGQTAAALLSPADYILQTRQHSLQFRVQVTTGICTTERTCQTSTKSQSISEERGHSLIKDISNGQTFHFTICPFPSINTINLTLQVTNLLLADNCPRNYAGLKVVCQYLKIVRYSQKIQSSLSHATELAEQYSLFRICNISLIVSRRHKTGQWHRESFAFSCNMSV